jgi:hypothetical protein
MKLREIAQKWAQLDEAHIVCVWCKTRLWFGNVASVGGAWRVDLDTGWGECECCYHEQTNCEPCDCGEHGHFGVWNDGYEIPGYF